MSEEALKLVGALSDWAREHGSDLGTGLSGLADHAAGAAHGADEHLATGAPECTWCPVCRVVHVVRQTSPEVRAHLAVAASSLLQAAAGLLATAVPEDAGSRTAGVEHIDLEDEPADGDIGGDTDGDIGGDIDGDTDRGHWPGEDEE
ncbi:hypothetical protein [Nocardioides panaciterrulae]|uniref:Uncharacterized protein n=1 Tax=Nocardioides panaciterrulae TaxID=661492 RepID=A0A7Y9JBK8_9ACTN|nr:hypothetical protein [Nocardioides panaciterrulae]NYD42306.1 hypothetical protein [Nocardioides panaciterrulae]